MSRPPPLLAAAILALAAAAAGCSGKDDQAAHDLVRLHDDAVQVTAAGWYVVRAVAMVFDRYLSNSASRERFSRLV